MYKKYIQKYTYALYKIYIQKYTHALYTLHNIHLEIYACTLHNIHSEIYVRTVQIIHLEIYFCTVQNLLSELYIQPTWTKNSDTVLLMLKMLSHFILKVINILQHFWVSAQDIFYSGKLSFNISYLYFLSPRVWFCLQWQCHKISLFFFLSRIDPLSFLIKESV